MNYPHVQYYLSNPINGRDLLQFEPLNWDEDDKRLVRNIESWGVFTELSNDLEFVGDGRDYIISVFENQGTEAQLVLERWELRDINVGYELDYQGFLDLKTYSLNDRKVSIQFLTGGLQSLIESQFDENYELERTTDIDGDSIPALEYKSITWEGRRIFLESASGSPNQLQQDGFFCQVNNDNDRLGAFVPTLSQLYESDGLDIFGVTPQAPNRGVQNSPLSQSPLFPLPTSSEVLFINQTDVDRTVMVKVNLNFDFNLRDPFQGATSTQFDERSNYILVIGLAKYLRTDAAPPGTYEFVENIALTSSSDWWTQIVQPNDIGNLQGESPFFDIILEPQQAIVPVVYALETSPTPADVVMQIDFSNINMTYSLQENSVFPTTTFNSLKLYDAFKRMLEIYTADNDRFRSEYFRGGLFKDVLLSSGKHIRNLPFQTEDSSPTAKISISLKDLYETNNYFNLGWHVERIQNKEYFVVEDKPYYFQNQVVLDLGDVANLVVASKPEFLFKSVTLGNGKAGDYEEVQGLQEYNARSSYVTALKTSDNEYDVEGKVRADLVGAELARRKNYTVAPNTDTRYDNENFLFDSKLKGGDEYELKVWQDSLDSEPICYDPQTAGNLLLTPFRSLERHSLCFNAGTRAYQDLFTRYSSGSGATDVATQLPNEPLRYENGDIINSDLKIPLYEAVEYTFNRQVTTDIRRLLNDKTLVNGRLIPNVYFLIKFAFKTKIYYGYISEVSYNGQGEWKLIKKFEYNADTELAPAFIPLPDLSRPNTPSIIDVYNDNVAPNTPSIIDVYNDNVAPNTPIITDIE